MEACFVLLEFRRSAACLWHELQFTEGVSAAYITSFGLCALWHFLQSLTAISAECGLWHWVHWGNLRWTLWQAAHSTALCLLLFFLRSSVCDGWHETQMLFMSVKEMVNGVWGLLWQFMQPSSSKCAFLVFRWHLLHFWSSLAAGGWLRWQPPHGTALCLLAAVFISSA